MHGNRVNRRRFLGAAAGFAAVAPIMAPGLSFGQAYPSRPIRVIVPFAAGGPSDIIARIVADAMRPRLGQSMVIDNRAGGGANIGIGQAARAEPDGYTVLITTSAIVINPSLYKKIPFDPSKDFAPICDLAISPQMLSVLPGYVNTLAEFIAKAKEAKGKLNYSSPGLGTQAQLTVELLEAARRHRHHPCSVHRRAAGGGGAAVEVGRARDQCGADQREARPCRHPPSAGGERQGPLVLAAEGADTGGVGFPRLHHRHLRRPVCTDRDAEGDRRRGSRPRRRPRSRIRR